jgi:hypothetical protein
MKKASYSCARNVNRYRALLKYVDARRVPGRDKLMSECRRAPNKFERRVDLAHARRKVFGHAPSNRAFRRKS